MNILKFEVDHKKIMENLKAIVEASKEIIEFLEEQMAEIKIRNVN